MAFQQVPDTAMFTFVQSVGVPYPGLYPILTSLYVRNTIAERDPQYFADICNDLITWWTTYWAPLAPSSVVLDSVSFRDLNEEFGLNGAVVSGAPGTNLGKIAGGYMSTLFRLQGDAGGAPRRGRMFMGPPTESQVDDSTGDSLTSGAVTAAQAALDELSNAAAAHVSDAMVLVSRYQNNALRPVAVTNTLSSTTVSPLLASQTRRRRLH